MVTRVATFYRHTQSLAQIQKASSALDTASYQLTSGLKARRYEEIAGDVNQILTLKTLTQNNNIFVKNIDAVQSRLAATENAVQSLSDLLVEASNVYTQARNELSPEVRATLAPKAQGLVDTFFNILNSQFEGRYLFSGQASEAPPTSVTGTPNPFPGDPPPTAYYIGDPQRQIVVDGPNSTTEYGVTGDHDAFARTKAGLEALWFGLQNNSLTDIDGAIDLLQNAQDDVANVLGEIGGTINGLDLIKDRHTNTNVFVKGRIDELEKADVAEASTRFAQEEVVLEASLSITTRLLQINLLNYLR